MEFGWRDRGDDNEYNGDSFVEVSTIFAMYVIFFFETEPFAIFYHYAAIST